MVFTFTPHNFGGGFYGTYGINIDKGGSCLPATAGGTAAAATITCTVIADDTSMTLMEIAD